MINKIGSTVTGYRLVSSSWELFRAGKCNRFASITESGKETALAESVEFLRMEGHYAVYAVGSDRYNFCAASPQSLK